MLKERLRAEGERASEDEMAGRHHQYNGYELGQTLGDGEGQEGLACCSSWGCRVRHDWVTEKQQQSYFLEFLKSDLSIFSFLTLCFMSHLERACPFLLAFFNFLC